MSSFVTILCCLCGASIQANGVNMCNRCMLIQVENVDALQIQEKGTKIFQCRRCFKWMASHKGRGEQWVAAEPESFELLALCLKRIHSLNPKEVVDASFIWTEPHSKRLKVKITLKREVLGGAALQHQVVVELTVVNRQCNGCAREFNSQAWKAVMQLRQRIGHKRTFFALEQQMHKANVLSNCVDVQQCRGGMDFYFSEKGQAEKCYHWLTTVVPVKQKTSRKLVSEDNHSNVHNVQHCISVDIVPLCRDDLIITPKKSASVVGKLSNRLLLVESVASSVHLLDPFTLETCEVTAEKYFKNPDYAPALFSASSLAEYIVLDIEPLTHAWDAGRAEDGRAGAAKSGRKASYLLAEAEVIPAADTAVADKSFLVTTHLGNILQPGDSVQGYAVGSSNLNCFGEAVTSGLKRELPDVVLVRKMRHKSVKKKERKGAKGAKAALPQREKGADTALDEKEAEDYLLWLQEQEAEHDAEGEENVEGLEAEEAEEVEEMDVGPRGGEISESMEPLQALNND
ncbi:unnamed protein product [Chrysoparadoxa australica]